jgi:YVTN family beta-propeller protein
VATDQAIKPLRKKIFPGIRSILLLVLVVIGLVTVWLAFPWTPSKSKTLGFEGFIELPTPKLLNILDYLSLHNNVLFVTNENSGSVYRIALPPDQMPAHAVVAIMTGAPKPHHVALVASGQTAYVTRSETNSVDAFDANELHVLSAIPVAEGPDSLLYDPESELIYVANGDSKLATLIDPKERKVVATIPLGAKPEFQALDPQTHLLYQNLEDTNAVVAIDLRGRRVIEQWALQQCEAPTGMALDDIGRNLFIVCNQNAKLVVFDLVRHRVIAALPIGGGPDSVVFDPALHRIYTTGKSGVLTVLDQTDKTHYVVLDNIHTHFGAHTLAVDLNTHRVFLGYASVIASPRVAVFSVKP